VRVRVDLDAVEAGDGLAGERIELADVLDLVAEEANTHVQRRGSVAARHSARDHESRLGSLRFSFFGDEVEDISESIRSHGKTIASLDSIKVYANSALRDARPDAHSRRWRRYKHELAERLKELEAEAGCSSFSGSSSVPISTSR